MIARLVLVLLLACGSVFAQTGRGFPWWDRPISKGLNLTDAQQQQIRKTVREYRDRLIEARAAVQKAEGDLQDVFDEDTIDMKRGTMAIDNLANARQTLVRTVSELDLRLRAVLTAQQWHELQRRLQAASAQQQQQRQQRLRQGPASTETDKK
jgi:Spy/CpxP family protein refolding chaperone